MQAIEHDIIVTNADLERLQAVIEQHDSAASDALDTELARAIVVEPGAVPADVVTMNSDVVYEDCETGVQRRVTLVYPKDADVHRGRVSVLAPIGSALLGLRVGQSITWRVPTGEKTIRLLAVHYQPEANGEAL